MRRAKPVTTYPRQLTQPDLDRLIEHTSALTEMRGLLPIDLFIKLDTFRADLLAEQEDRAVQRVLRRAGAGRGRRSGQAQPSRRQSHRR
jgi:hypothetical protein